MTKRYPFLIACLALILVLPGCSSKNTGALNNTTPPTNALQVIFFDIGQGDAALIRFPNGKTMLVDGGPPESGKKLVDKLSQLGLRELDWVVASHPHSDHIGGLIEVLGRFQVKEIWDSGFVYASPVYKEYLQTIKTLKSSGTKFRMIRAGYRLEPSGGCRIEVYAPREPFLKETDSDPNNNSLVFRLTYQKASFLFTGDMQKEQRQRIYAQRADLRASVLKVAHHGSHNGTDRIFLARVRPRVAVISCALGNSYGHPHRETLRDLQRAGVQVYRTDLQGDITLTVQSNRLTVTTERQATASQVMVPPSRGATQGAMAPAKSETGGYIGNSKSMIYHTPNCPSLPKPENRVPFRSKEEAEKRGYRPHEDCVGG